MTTRSLPHALEPYLRLPPETSLILLTSTLGCSVSWITVRFVGSVLSSENGSAETPSVLLVSWLRDLTFWKTEIRRATGLDIIKPPLTTQFAFVDCFTKPNIDLPETERIIATALTNLTQSNPNSNPGPIVLILDSPDILLATANTNSQALDETLLKLRSLVHAAILTCSADFPLLSAAASSPEVQPTPIEAETAAFATTQAHAARLVLSVRELDTGAAKDISGVLRITKGGSVNEFAEDSDVAELTEAELLYLVLRDGNVKVFNRGSDVA